MRHEADNSREKEGVSIDPRLRPVTAAWDALRAALSRSTLCLVIRRASVEQALLATLQMVQPPLNELGSIPESCLVAGSFQVSACG